MTGNKTGNSAETTDYPVRFDLSVFTAKSIECVECGVTFDFAPGEQAYFKSKQLSDPKRCPKCRKFRKESLVVDKSV